MRSMRILVWCALGLSALLLAVQGLRSSARDKAGDTLKAEDVLKEWGFPKADVQGPYWPRNDKDTKEHADLANQALTAKEQMEKVWKYYADKCGHKGKFPGPGAGVRDGTGTSKARYLMNFSGGCEGHKAYRCTFAYHTDRYTVFVELSSGWADQSTGVQVTVGTKKAAELKWAKEVVTDFMSAGTQREYDQATVLLSAELRKALEKSSEPGSTFVQNRFSVYLKQAKDWTITSEAIAPDEDEAVFRGKSSLDDMEAEYTVRVVKEKDSGKWRVNLFTVGKWKKKAASPKK
jgi:hypothetical protein